jgi:hypothetical protein
VHVQRKAAGQAASQRLGVRGGSDKAHGGGEELTLLLLLLPLLLLPLALGLPLLLLRLLPRVQLWLRRRGVVRHLLLPPCTMPSLIPLQLLLLLLLCRLLQQLLLHCLGLWPSPSPRQQMLLLRRLGLQTLLHALLRCLPVQRWPQRLWLAGEEPLAACWWWPWRLPLWGSLLGRAWCCS